MAVTNLHCHLRVARGLLPNPVYTVDLKFLTREIAGVADNDAMVHRIEIDHRSPRAQRKRKFVDAAAHLNGFALHPAGHSREPSFPILRRPASRS